MTTRAIHGAMLSAACAIGLLTLGCNGNQCPNGAEQCGAVQAGLPPGHECPSTVTTCQAAPDWSAATFEVHSSTAPAPGGSLPDVNITVKLSAVDSSQRKCVRMAGEVRAAQPSTVRLPFDPAQMPNYPDLLSSFNSPCEIRMLEMTAFPTDAGISCGCKSVRKER